MLVGTLGTYPDEGSRNALTIPGENSKQEGATDRACISPILFREEMASKKIALRVTNLSGTSSMGSNGARERPSSTMARSQNGTLNWVYLPFSAPRGEQFPSGGIRLPCGWSSGVKDGLNDLSRET
ncbi:hypothetical protein DPEC_G00332020 [Dallia pectoralis]|uniref:Uncharacterized protein n=1 Tax=Dallia pectoralis TaxID=75939 RepID=A0ACC2F601_DALPE|nr:hypothetical protein DPEC_G00332020 [Dallia pectoralis]